MRTAIVGTGLLFAALAGASGPEAAAEEPKRPAARPAPPNPGPCPNDPDAPLADRVRKAIDLGVAWLKQGAPKTGNWGNLPGEVNYEGGTDVYRYPAGMSALALYTLLKCGVPPDDPVVARGFQFLRKHEETPGSSYEIAAVVLALEARANPRKREGGPTPGASGKGKRPPVVRPAPADAAWMKKLLDQLVRRREKRPGWRYNLADPPEKGPIASASTYGGDLDMSATQFAMLAFAAGERCGMRQPDPFYVDTLKWVLDQQATEGPTIPRPGTPHGETAVGDRARGWTYLPRERKDAGAVTGSMTACGMATISIAGAILADRKNPAWTGGLADRAERAWWDGSAWFSEHWSIPRNPGGSSDYYYLYCIERAGDLRGVRLLGGHDWYSEGAQHLVDAQYPDGSWWGLSEGQPEDFLGTCFALLFLDRSARGVATGE